MMFISNNHAGSDLIAKQNKLETTVVVLSQHFDPLTAGAEYIGFFIQLLPQIVPLFKHVEAIMSHQSARF